MDNSLPQVAVPAPGLEVVQDRWSQKQFVGHEGNSAASPELLDEKSNPAPRKKIAGLQPRTFWLVLVLFTILIIGAAVGGGVGGSLHARDQRAKSQSTATPEKTVTVTDSRPPSISASSSFSAPTASISSVSRTATTTLSPTETYIPVPAADVPFIDNKCPDDPLMSFNGERFDCENNVDLNGGDLTSLNAYSLKDCIDACSQFSELQTERCWGVILDRAMNSRNRFGGNCWLKKGLSNTNKLNADNMTAARLIHD